MSTTTPTAPEPSLVGRWGARRAARNASRVLAERDAEEALVARLVARLDVARP